MLEQAPPRRMRPTSVEQALDARARANFTLHLGKALGSQVVVVLTPRAEELQAPDRYRRLVGRHERTNNPLHVNTIDNSRGLVVSDAGVECVLECEENGGYEGTGGIVACAVEIGDREVEVREEVLEADEGTLGALDSRVLGHGLGVDDLDNGAVAEEVDAEFAQDVVEFIVYGMADEDDGLQVGRV